MKRLLGVAIMALLCVSLAGCVTTTQLGAAINSTVVNPINNKTVKGAEVGLGLVGSGIAAYVALPLCPAGTAFQPDNWCHDKAVLVTLDTSQNLAVKAVGDLVAFQKQFPAGAVVVGPGFSAKLSAANAAIGAVQGLMKSYAIGGAS